VGMRVKVFLCGIEGLVKTKPGEARTIYREDNKESWTVYTQRHIA